MYLQLEAFTTLKSKLPHALSAGERCGSFQLKSKTDTELLCFEPAHFFTIIAILEEVGSIPADGPG